LLTPAHLFRMLNQLVFVLLGGLLVWLGLTNRFFFDPRKSAWLLMGAVLLTWGVGSCWRASRIPIRTWRIVMQIRGASLGALGALMLSMAWLEFRWTGAALTAAGIILIVRGVVSAALFASAT
jgi:hypothetical protein